MSTKNNKSYVVKIALSILTLTSQPAMSDEPLKISSGDIPQYIKSNGLTYKEIETRPLSTELLFEKLNAVYKWNLGLDYSKEFDQTESIASGTPPDSTKDKASLLINKKFSTSTSTTFELTQINYQSDVIASNAYSQNYFSATLDQNLFPFFSTAEDQLLLTSLSSDARRAKIQADLDLNELTKDAYSLFWKTLAAQKSVQENTELLKRYEGLVKTIQRKKQNSYASAGELEQALAEYELRKQTLLEDSNTLQNYLLQFKQTLNIDPKKEIQLIGQKNTASLNAKVDYDLKKLKRYELQKLKTESANDAYQAVYNKGLPRIGIYGRFTQQGFDSDKSTSFKEMINESKDKYTVGIKLNYDFDDTVSAKEKELRLAMQVIETERFNRIEADLAQQILLVRQRLENAFTNLKTTQTVLKYRLEAVKQLTVNYTQGRTDISFLIDAFNKKITAEVAAINAMGAYETALIEYTHLVTY